MAFALRVYATGMVAGTTATGLQAASGLINLWLLTQILGKGQLASYVFAITLVFGGCVLGTGGLDRLVLFRAARLDAPPGQLAGADLVATVLRRVSLTSVALAGVLASLGFGLGGRLSLPDLAFWLSALAPMVIALCLSRVFEAWYRARQWVGVALLVPALGELSRSLGLALAYVVWPTALGVVLAVLVSALVPLAVWLSITPVAASPARPLTRADRRYSAKTMLSLATLEGTQRLDIVMVGIFAGPIATAHYVVASRAVALLRLGEPTFGHVLGPRMARDHVQGHQVGLRREYDQARLAGLVVALLGAAALTVLGPELFLVFGDYRASYPLAMILAAGAVTHMAFGFNVVYLNMTGRPGRVLVLRIVLLAVMIVVNAVLIPTFGVSGAAMGRLALITMTNLALFWIIWRLDRLATIAVPLAGALTLAVALLLFIAWSDGGARGAAGGGLLALVGALLATQRYLWWPLTKTLLDRFVRVRTAR